MKPSGPGLLFAGRFFITISISVLVMGSHGFLNGLSAAPRARKAGAVSYLFSIQGKAGPIPEQG